MTTRDTKAPLLFRRTLADGFKSDSISNQLNCLHMSIPSNNYVISKCISCSISGLSNQCNETQSKSSSVISGQWIHAPLLLHSAPFTLHIHLTVVVYRVCLHLYSNLVHYFKQLELEQLEQFLWRNSGC